MAGSRLTWYAGSILPFASLWHTLLRVAALNALRARDLPDAVTEREPGGQSSFTSGANLLFNEVNDMRAECISTRALSRWLGESVEAFEWSHLGRLPKGLRAIVHKGLRVCPECLALGYHSALLSVNLLKACPIHGCELLEKCRCGRPFEGRLDGKELLHPGSCECGRLAYFTHQTCRWPEMTVVEAQQLSPIARWLDALATVVGQPRSGVADQGEFMTTRWLEHLQEWSEMLDIGYPSCFVKLPRQAWLRVVSTTGPPAAPTVSSRRTKLTRDLQKDIRKEGRYWDVNPGTWAYRGMLRHLRRHVNRGGEAYAVDFLNNPDPLRIAAVMQANRQAVVAFAEMLWSARMEQYVMRRRWPHRLVEQGFGGDYVGRVSPPYAANQGMTALWNSDVWRRWVQYQSCRSLMLGVWREAQRLALNAVRTGIADWDMGMPEDAFRWATVQCEDSIRLVALEGQEAWDWSLPQPDKERRREGHLAAAVRRLHSVESECVGLCLTWSERDAWTVRESMVPSGVRVDRHRLLGAGKDRPKFWLFQSDDLFVARWCDVKLQVLAETPRAAIEAMRCAINQHRRTYQPPAASTPMIETKPVRDMAQRDYELRLNIIQRNHGFWRGAPLFRAIARDYLEGRRQGSG